MPELPEVETVRRGLRPVLENRQITFAETRREGLRIPFPANLAKRLKGRSVEALRRRAKYLLADLENGVTWVIHLGMSGRVTVFEKERRHRVGDYVYTPTTADAGAGKHDHVVIETDAPARIVFSDHRRFGLMTLIDTDGLDSHPLFAALGPEPLSEEFNGTFLHEALAGKKAPIKSALLDQHVVAGLGNIYACEALYRARISPKRAAKALRAASCNLLVEKIDAVLADAIKAGGSSLRDHQRVDGELGHFQHQFAVYGREGKMCLTGCGGKVRRIVQAGRSTFYCPKCQK